MSIKSCEGCRKREVCKKVCRKLENALAREQSREGYSERHIRRKEIPYAPEMVDVIIHQPRKGYDNAGGGFRKKSHNIDENE